MRNYPFPDRILSREELERDLLYEKIPEDDRAAIADRAWDTGVEVCNQILDRYPNRNIYEIAEESGLTIERKAEDHVISKLRYFSEYYSRDNKIMLYTLSIEKWCEQNDCTYEEGEELIMAHEFYHFLETVEIGETSEQYKVPTLKLGKRVIVTSGIRALAEIGAHGFALTYYENRYGEANPEKQHQLRNYTVNIVENSKYLGSRNLFKELFKR